MRILGRSFSLLFLIFIFTAAALAAAPTITSFSPASGPIGTTVVITGTGFSTTPANNFVYFGATRATVSTASATSLTVTVPFGATLWPISVMTGGLTGYSSAMFNVTFAGRQVLDATSFAPHVDYLTHDPYNVALGDVDGDGKSDLIVTNQFDTTISVFRNTSISGQIDAGSVAAPLIVRVARRPVGIAFGDLDGDGKPDIAIVDLDASQVSVLRNTSTPGSISFAAQVLLSTPAGAGPFNVAIEDLNGDGKPEIAVANDIGGTVSVWQNNSTPGSLTAGSFGTRVDFTTGADPFVMLADVNGDGKADIIAANWGASTVSVFRNLGTGGTITTSSFAARVDFTTGSHPFSVAVGDLDGDGKLDLVTANENAGTATLLRNLSAGTTINFAAKIDLVTDGGSRFTAISDLDGDGKLDLAVVNRVGSDISLLKNQSTPGTLSFIPSVNIPANFRCRNIVAGDVDNDGLPELYVANEGNVGSSANNVSVFRNVLGTGFLITATAGANGTITPSGGITVNPGNSQGFTIAPSAGYHIDSVFVDGVSQGPIASFTFNNVNANHTISAKFAINTFTITASAGANGSINPNGSVVVNFSANQAFSATPAAGYHVDSLLVDGVNQGALTNFTFLNVTANHTIRAVFAINQFTITASAGANGSIAPNGVTQVSFGGSVGYTIVPATGYHVDSLLVDGANQGLLTAFNFTNVSANHTIRAVFAINQYAITPSAGANGSITPSTTVLVNHGGSQLFTMTPLTGYHVDSVLVDGVNQGNGTTFTFTNVTAPHAIRAVFAINQFTITATSGPNGSITPSDAVVVNYNASQAFLIAAAAGYHIDSVLVDGANAGAVSGFTFNNVTTNHTIRAVFAINQYTITATAGPNGAISPSGSVVVNFGASQGFTMVPNSGFHPDSVIVDGANQGQLSAFTFTSVAANHTIRVVFTLTPPDASFKLGLTVHSSGAPLRNLSWGIHNGASSGIFGVYAQATAADSAEGEFELPPPLGTIFDARFVDPAGGGALTFGNGSLTDVRNLTSASQADTYKVALQAGPSGVPMKLNWSKSAVAGAYNGPATLVDNLSNSVDMKAVDSLVISNPSVTSVRIIAQAPNLPVFFEPGWNLTSLPVVVTDGRKTILFPRATSKALSFDNLGGYVQRDTLVAGPGYWLKFPVVVQPFAFPGTAVLRDTIDLEAGWNLFGGVNAPVSAAAVTTIPPGILVGSIFGYGTSYTVTDSISPYRAYWVQSTASGKLVLNGSGSPKISAASMDVAGTLLVTDAAGHSQQLIVASRASDLREFGLPPSPPPGAFDVRYASQRSVEIAGSARQFAVEISGAAYPLTLQWSSFGSSALVHEGSATYRFGTHGSAVLSQSSGDAGTLEIQLEPTAAGSRPTAFALGQNYPNPFNPTTQITYALPENASVRLRVFSLLGEEVRMLADGVQEAGLRGVEWDGMNGSGAPVASGIYFYRLEARPTAHPEAGFTEVRRMMLLR